MPCRDWDDDVRYVEVERDRPQTVRMLCDALNALMQHRVDIPTSCRVWWAAHQKEDAARRVAEQQKLNKEKARKAILSKLTDEEKKILGVK